ncbi:reverse transcriptase [compost metagenome]
MDRNVPIIDATQLSLVNPSLRDPVEYRKSGLSLNHIVGCPLDCSYCVRHLFGNFDQPRVLPWHKARGGCRVVHQLEPLDALIYTALVYLVAEKAEQARMGPEVSCAYLIEVSHNSFFSRGSGFDTYRENCEQLASQHSYALSTDISDFYNQIYLHRIRNGQEEIGAGAALAKEIESFLMRLNIKSSQGLPVGPAASIILAEAALIDVDQFIAQRGLEHVRYVDDYRIFSDDEADLKIILEDLVVYLH